MSTELAIKHNVALDMTGSMCPGPLLGAKKLIDGLAPGQVLLLISDCPGTEDDLFSWVKYTGNQILKTEKMPGGALGFYIQRAKTKQRKANAVLDMRGVSCPGPIVEAKRLLNGMGPGEVLRLVSNCPGITTDITGWVKATGVKLVDSVETAPGEYEFYIAKR
ncbi:MAG TPA: sulfurtransferase TusA family protein [Casimicrobiaceae bacterium]